MSKLKGQAEMSTDGFELYKLFIVASGYLRQLDNCGATIEPRRHKLGGVTELVMHRGQGQEYAMAWKLVISPAIKIRICSKQLDYIIKRALDEEIVRLDGEKDGKVSDVME